jgi:hypothetical protein
VLGLYELSSVRDDGGFDIKTLRITQVQNIVKVNSIVVSDIHIAIGGFDHEGRGVVNAIKWAALIDGTKID